MTQEKDLYLKFDLLFLPGGLPGAQTFAASHVIHSLLKDFYTNNRLMGLICAAPIALKEARIAGGRESWIEGKIKVTSHPSVKAQLEDEFTYVEDDVVVHHHLVTRCVAFVSCFSLDLDRSIRLLTPILLSCVRSSRGPGTSILFVRSPLCSPPVRAPSF